MSDTYERVKNVTAAVLKIEPAIIQPESRFVEELGAQSIQSLELVAGFEEEFDVDINEDAALKIKTVGDATTFITDLLE